MRDLGSSVGMLKAELLLLSTVSERLSSLSRRMSAKEGFAIAASHSLDGSIEYRVFLEPLSKLLTYLDSGKRDSLTELQQFLNGGKERGEWSTVALHYELLHQEADSTFSPPHTLLPPIGIVAFSYRTVLTLTETQVIVETASNSTAVPLWSFHEGNNEGEFLSKKISQEECSLHALASLVERHSNFSRGRYEEAVESIRSLILEGKVYQVNLSQQITLPYSASPGELFTVLQQESPAPRSYYLHFTANNQKISYVSASPELFFHVKENLITCLPIKGTRKRALEYAEDQALVAELKKSSKDRAELAMIVDVVRNDLSYVCELGTVKVYNHATVHSYPSVHHLVTEVEGIVEEETELTKVIRALFPCSSITGAPKRAAMTYIRELEGCQRGIYTGSLGWVAPSGEAHFNVAIRTAIVTQEQLLLSCGGGVVIDSSAESEYWETIIKAANVLRLWELFQS